MGTKPDDATSMDLLNMALAEMEDAEVPKLALELFDSLCENMQTPKDSETAARANQHAPEQYLTAARMVRLLVDSIASGQLWPDSPICIWDRENQQADAVTLYTVADDNMGTQATSHRWLEVDTSEGHKSGLSDKTIKRLGKSPYTA